MLLIIQLLLQGEYCYVRKYKSVSNDLQGLKIKNIQKKKNIIEKEPVWKKEEKK